MKGWIALGAAALLSASGGDAAARARAQAAVTIAAPLEKVWALVVEIDRWPQWNKAVTRARLQGPLAAGLTFTWTSGGLEIRSTLQEIAPMQRLSWTGRTLGVKALHAWTFASTDRGVVVTTTETFSGWLPTLMPKTMQKMLDDTLPALLASLKAAAEADGSGG